MSEREPMSGTPDCGGDAAAYVLGALEPHEAEAFRAHMQECAVCRDEVEVLGGVVQTLPMAVHQYEAPRDLRRRIMRDVRHQPRAERAPAVRRPLWRRPRELFAVGAATVLAGAGVVVGIELSAGAAATVIMAQVAPRIAGSAQLRVSGGHGELVVHHLTSPGRGRVYEVWLQRGSAAPVPASVLFAVNSSGDADVGIPARMHGISAVLVTAEPLGGTQKPTEAPVIVARLS